ncbi:MAG: agmatine deiminase family protein [Planctomycetota bacterium]
MHVRPSFIVVAAVLTLVIASCEQEQSSNTVLPKQDDTVTQTVSDWRLPDESEPHARTWMAFATREDIWGDDLLWRVQEDIARIANTIVAFEPVSILVRPEDRSIAESLLDDEIEIVEAVIDDLWIRDTGACFVVNSNGSLGAVDLNFNGWGNKQEHGDDAAVAALLARRTDAEHIRANLIGEGGGIEVDGHGTAIITESCFVNTNRNPGMSRNEIEAELNALFGLRKIIWLPGIAGKDITDGHTDFYARFVWPGVVVAALDTDPASFDHAVTKRHLEILRAATDADGRALKVFTLETPQDIRDEFAGDDFAAGYVNFYVCNGAVIAPEFGDAEADAAARRTLEKLFPTRTIVQIDIDGIAAGGGGIHCATMQQPRSNAH